MDTSTPKRRYYLRSSDRTNVSIRLPFDDSNIQNGQVPLRKRTSPSEESRCHKRQRTQQSHGPPFQSPDCLQPPRQANFVEDPRTIINLPKRLSLENTLLGRMAMTSNSWNQAVLSYIRSGSFRLRWIADVENAPERVSLTSTSDDIYFSMGTLTKYMTVNDNWETRLSCLKSVLTVAYEVGASIAGLGKMIYAFALRPDEELDLDEIDDIISMVFSVVGSLKDELNGVINRPDIERSLENRDNLHIWYYEMELRNRTLALFLNNGSADPAYGLNKYFLGSLLKLFKDIHGVLPTAIFYLLYSPTIIHENEEVIHWHRLSLVSVMNSEDASELKPFARAIYGLLLCRKMHSLSPWTKNTIFNLMEEVTTYPNPWSMNTFVSLHVLEPELVPIGVVARMNRNHEDEAGDMICTMKMLLHRWNMDVQGVMERAIESIKNALKGNQRRVLFDRCWDWHQRNIDELRDRFGPFNDIRAEIESQLEVMPVLMSLL
ncbi:hypothetical protein CAEBREN_31986 [Caenorhabditis brenneri]|uniref:FBXO47 ARM repeats region domain-containing protein n=1 Tax=Caenorhabditis brenneri TaxID=135651 RepID=G0PGG0_CAEBE|nr:hypothetical protein CAEBREN_31986 [Caenorhabditis brenneri]